MPDSFFPGRFTAADSADGFVLVRIGMRFNGIGSLMSTLKTLSSMPKMLAEQQAKPEIGLLWSTTQLSWPVISVTQFWRSFDDLERYAVAPEFHHVGLWRWYNKLGRRSENTGIWHETYRIAPGSYESIYVNMPVYGLAAAIGHTEIVPAKTRARQRIEGDSAA